MDGPHYRLNLYLPAQAAAVTEATIIEWNISVVDRFWKGEVLAQVDSAKSVFDFEAPCEGMAIRLFHLEGETVSLAEPLMEIETSDSDMKDWIPPAASGQHVGLHEETTSAADAAEENTEPAVILGVGGHLPDRIVTNAELVEHFPKISEQYVYQVTGIRQRHWAADGEKPSDMAF